MKAIADLTLGNSRFTFEAEEKDDKEALLKVIALANPRSTCNICSDKGFTNKRLNARRAKSEKGSFIYISVKCLNCGASSTLGEYQEGGYFWKEYEQYVKDNSLPMPENAKVSKNKTHEEMTIDDISA